MPTTKQTQAGQATKSPEDSRRCAAAPGSGWVPRELVPDPDFGDECVSELQRCEISDKDGRTRPGISFMVEVPDGINATEIVLTNGQLQRLLDFGRYKTRPRKLNTQNT